MVSGRVLTIVMKTSPEITLPPTFSLSLAVAPPLHSPLTY